MSSDYTTWGVQENGTVIPTAAEILESIENDQQSIIQSNLDLKPESPIGQVNGIIAPQLGRLWELFGALEASRSRDGAEKYMLDEQGILTGYNRELARPTSVVCTVSLDAGTKLTVDNLASLRGKPDITFYAYVDATTGFTAPSTGTYSIVFKCTQNGPIVVPPGTLTVITTPLSGWNSITNPLAGVTGAEVASDYETRQGQEASLATTGSSTAKAIAADLKYNATTGEGIPGCLEAYVLENDTGTTVDGLPAHSIECVLYTDGTSVPSVIAEKIFLAKGATTGTYGSLYGDYVEKNGDTHRVYYSVITAIEIKLNYTIVVNSNYIGDAALKTAIVSEMTARAEQGEDVNYTYARAIPLHYAGIEDVTAMTIAKGSDTPITTNYPISGRQLAVFYTTNISIVK